jgi:two-component system nitrate/nitrite response regulator NarL
MDSRPSIAIAGRSTLLRDVLRDEAARNGMVVLCDVEDLAELVSVMDGRNPDVVIVELGDDDPWSTQLADVRLLGAPVVVITDDVSPDNVVALLSAGVDGVFRSDATMSDVINGALSVLDGGAALHGDVAALVLHQWRVFRGARAPGTLAGRNSLTSREHDVLVAMAEGLSTKAIARRLGVALKTVENHKTRVYQKLGARSNAHAISMAIRLGLLQPVAAPATLDLRERALLLGADFDSVQ